MTAIEGVQILVPVITGASAINQSTSENLIKEAGSSEGASGADGKTLDDGKQVPQPRDKHKTKTGRVGDLGAKGEPNSSEDLVDENGELIQRRFYGPDGKVEYDIDFKHGNSDGSHNFPHRHDWDWNQNPPRQ